jgi:hypothetical protein
VQYEALLAGIGQRDYLGVPAAMIIEIHRLLEATGAPAVALRLVLDMLFPDTAGKQAATAIEQCVLVSGWIMPLVGSVSTSTAGAQVFAGWRPFFCATFGALHLLQHSQHPHSTNQRSTVSTRTQPNPARARCGQGLTDTHATRHRCRYVTDAALFFAPAEPPLGSVKRLPLRAA